MPYFHLTNMDNNITPKFKKNENRTFEDFYILILKDVW